MTGSFFLGTFSVQKESSRFLSVLAFLLVLCVCLEGRGVFLLVQGFKIQIFKESSELLSYEPRTLNFEPLNFEQLNLQPLKSNI
ncbi:hypothetical protein FO615_01705 [Riemerella anatipestifer]|nr:hypothetical protein [Riemerella anatipestifer]MDD1595763.1 hypothetical protein [Riemerella anatipestifer]MDD1598612.1 hypothetical protein [Riemerella anatipestifer]MSN82163.1 hypothetical protein [Riemerella anatipestifer]MSN85159.1 hypothetical protein [Riemerella anatipestifer]